MGGWVVWGLAGRILLQLCEGYTTFKDRRSLAIPPLSVFGSVFGRLE
jgi:hypothetical protein